MMASCVQYNLLHVVKYRRDSIQNAKSSIQKDIHMKEFCLNNFSMKCFNILFELILFYPKLFITIKFIKQVIV